MQGYNVWGASFEMSEEEQQQRRGAAGGNADMDRASLQAARLREEQEESADDRDILLMHETQQSWLLQGSSLKKKKKKKKEYIDLGCFMCSKRLAKYIGAASIAAILLTVFIVLLVKFLPHHHPPPPSEDTYTQALHKTLLFFNAQRSGVLPKNNNVSWRKNSAVTDGQPTADLSGGYYDAGDNIKFGFPGAFAITILSWSAVEYGPKYEAMGELDHVKDLIKWGTDYILKTFNSTADSITQVYAQVGIGSNTGTSNDHSCWTRPEDMDYERPVMSCGACSDLAAEMAAALAAASIVFRDDPKYKAQLVHAATTVYKFARGPRGRYSAPGTDAVNFYNSTGYWDEYVWSSAWMYFATGNTSYLSLATSSSLAKNAGGIDNALSNRVLSWNNKVPAAQLILTRFRIMMSPPFPYEDVLQIYNNQTNLNMCAYMPRYKAFNMTKGGLMLFNFGAPQPLQYAAASAFLAALYADYLKAADAVGWSCGGVFQTADELRDFARSQVDYILGNNPRQMSYVVGWGSRYPRHVHHRGASIPSNVNSKGCVTAMRYKDSSSPDPHILVGAMVAGPDSQDRFSDVRDSFNYTEPTLVGNAFLNAALVALSTSSRSSASLDPNAIFSNLAPLRPPSPPPPAPWTP